MNGDGVKKTMSSTTLIMLIVALLAGITAAVATYQLVRSQQGDRKVDRSNDSLGPILKSDP